MQINNGIFLDLGTGPGTQAMQLAKKGLIKHHIQKFDLSEVNDAHSLLREQKILGRGVLIP